MARPEPNLQFWRDVEEAFAAVLAAGELGTTAAIETHCGGRPDLRHEVETLLVAHARVGDFIAPGMGPLARPEELDTHLHTQVGAFRLLERIATGGMGTVYRAERVAGDFTQKVAVKLIASTIYGADTLQRFRAERQILASLQHPHIVSLLDGGLTPEGRPYIAMEFVEGLPITEYCRKHALQLPARLQLFRQLCQAVSFAHRHLVVHRDLKPANVLVTADGTVKVLDFGVAKLLQPEARTAQATGVLLGPLTPDYASPEQLRGAPVTTTCDVYALGVMLFELISGRRPYDAAGRPVDEIMAVVLDAPPTRPSSAKPGGVPYHPRGLRGDLDAIVLRAMEKDPERRYPSSEELAEELQRYLEGRPVLARPPSLPYLASRSIARHKRAFAVAGVLVLLLLVTVAEALRQARVAARERERAERRFTQTQALAHAVIFKIHDALVGLPGTIRARQMIVDEARTYLQDLAEDPGADDDVRVKLAEAYRELGTIQGYPGIANLGDAAGAIASFERGLAVLEPIVARPGASLAALYEGSTLWARLSHTLASLPAQRQEAEQAARSALEVATRMIATEPGSDRTLRALADANIMLAYVVVPEQAAPHWQAALDQHSRLLAKKPSDLDRMVMAALMETNLAAHLEAQLDGAGARPHHRGAKVLYERLLALGPSVRQCDECYAMMLGNAGVAGIQLGELPEARRVLEEALAVRLALAKADPANANSLPKTALSYGELARAEEELGDQRAALEHARSAVLLFMRQPPEPKLLKILVESQLRIGRLAPRTEACPALEQAAGTLAQIATNGGLSPLERKRLDETHALRAKCPAQAGSR